MSEEEAMIDRRTLFKSAAVVPLAGLPEISCRHEPTFADKGEIMIVRFVATREREVPVLEFENWTSEMKECALCDQVWFEDHKVRTMAGIRFDGLMRVPPVVAEPVALIWPINSNCRAWIDGVEVDWMSGEKGVTGFGRDVPTRTVYL